MINLYLLEIARLQQQQMLQQAEARRLCRQLKGETKMPNLKRIAVTILILFTIFTLVAYGEIARAQ